MSLWTPDEDALLGTMTDAAVADRVGRAKHCVVARRRKLGVDAFDQSRAAGMMRRWTADEIALLGTAIDKEIGEQLGRTRTTVYTKRSSLGILSFEARRLAEKRS